MLAAGHGRPRVPPRPGPPACGSFELDRPRAARRQGAGAGRGGPAVQAVSPIGCRPAPRTGPRPCSRRVRPGAARGVAGRGPPRLPRRPTSWSCCSTGSPRSPRRAATCCATPSASRCWPARGCGRTWPSWPTRAWRGASAPSRPEELLVPRGWRPTVSLMADVATGSGPLAVPARCPATPPACRRASSLKRAAVAAPPSPKRRHAVPITETRLPENGDSPSWEWRPRLLAAGGQAPAAGRGGARRGPAGDRAGTAHISVAARGPAGSLYEAAGDGRPTRRDPAPSTSHSWSTMRPRRANQRDGPVARDRRRTCPSRSTERSGHRRGNRCRRRATAPRPGCRCPG